MNGEKQPEEKLVGVDVVKAFLEKHFNEIAGTLPDFHITIIAHNAAQNDHDIVVSQDNPEWLLRFFEKAVAHMKSTDTPH